MFNDIIKYMFLVGLLGWWYGAGFSNRIAYSKSQLANILAMFSVGQLLRTLFSPFRQISAGESNNSSMATFFQAFLDKTMSRLVGAVVRTLTIIAGLISVLGLVVYRAIVIALWILTPLLAVGFIILAIIGWVPSWR